MEKHYINTIIIITSSFFLLLLCSQAVTLGVTVMAKFLHLPTIQVVTSQLQVWFKQNEFLKLAFTCLGHER